jgi:DNA-binding MarR family transcriptional regulator
MVLSPEEFETLARARFRKEGPWVDVAANSVIMGMVIGAMRAEGALESEIHRPLDLTWSGFRMLFCLWICGPMNTGDLARMLFTTAPTVSSVLNTMEGRGYVERRRSSEDRRQVSIHLTPAGDKLIARAFRGQHALEKKWVAGLPAEDIAAFLRVLKHLTGRIQAEG